MRAFFQRAVWLTFLLGVVATFGRAAPAAESLAGVDEKWRHYRSPNFELYSHGNDRESRAVLRDLELVRALFLARFKAIERSRLEVTVYLFRNVGEFRAYAPDRLAQSDTLRGFYAPSRDRAVISLVAAADTEQARALVFHEYIHHLMRSAEMDPPLWFSEGLAELLAVIRVMDDTVEVGHPHTANLNGLRRDKLLPLELLFTADRQIAGAAPGRHIGLFYAQSWALLHYWYFGDSDLSKEAVAKFVRAVGERKPPASLNLAAFFRECFGMDYAQMQRRLESYIQRGSYRFARQRAPDIAPMSSYTSSALARNEARVHLAELALRIHRSAAARVVLLDALAKPDASARISEILGTDAMKERDDAAAREHWEQALAKGSTNAAIYRELGLLESRGWFRDFDFHFQLPPETAARLRTRLQRAIQNEPNQSASYEMLAWVEAFSPAPVVPNINLVQKQFPLLRDRARTLVALAVIRLRAGQVEEAKRLLNDLEKMEWDEWAAQAAESIRANLERRPPRTVLPPPAPNEIREVLRAGDRPPLKFPTIAVPDLP